MKLKLALTATAGILLTSASAFAMANTPQYSGQCARLLKLPAQTTVTSYLHGTCSGAANMSVSYAGNDTIITVSHKGFTVRCPAETDIFTIKKCHGDTGKIDGNVDEQTFTGLAHLKIANSKVDSSQLGLHSDEMFLTALDIYYRK